jgi:CopG family transcriptional regulator, nickel-responsive regulator
MPAITRLSFTIEESLNARLEKLIAQSGYTNRSEFIRDLIRGRIVEEEWRAEGDVLGTITLVYNHETRNLSRKLTAAQHHHHDIVLATTHVHLDHDYCAEMIMMRGPAASIETLADSLRREKGVLHAAVAISTPGRQLA